MNWFVKVTAFIPHLIAFRTKVYYEDKKAQRRRIKGKAIVVSNHRSVWDVATMMFLFPARTLRPLVAELMFEKNPLFSFFLRSLGSIKVDRNSHDFAFVAKSCDVLGKGGVIEIYPEARLPRQGEKRPLEFKSSAVYIALLSGAPIIPVYTNGAYFTKKRMRVIIGTPIDVRELYDDSLSEQDNLDRISKYLRDRIIELEDELNARTAKDGTKK